MPRKEPVERREQDVGQQLRWPPSLCTEPPSPPARKLPLRPPERHWEDLSGRLARWPRPKPAGLSPAQHLADQRPGAEQRVVERLHQLRAVPAA
eukprot:10673256-Lingulodinium_polyedra.AAC.1